MPLIKNHFNSPLLCSIIEQNFLNNFITLGVQNYEK